MSVCTRELELVCILVRVFVFVWGVRECHCKRRLVSEYLRVNVYGH